MVVWESVIVVEEASRGESGLDSSLGSSLGSSLDSSLRSDEGGEWYGRSGRVLCGSR